ncbi:hypothetical protein P4118_19950 [Pseudomonas aeruginosa]|nr:hypothetical protein [Pseudomonas aeruginosa]
MSDHFSTESGPRIVLLQEHAGPRRFEAVGAAGRQQHLVAATEQRRSSRSAARLVTGQPVASRPRRQAVEIEEIDAHLAIHGNGEFAVAIIGEPGERPSARSTSMT